jgi:hypothetical protein
VQAAVEITAAPAAKYDLNNVIVSFPLFLSLLVLNPEVCRKVFLPATASALV